MIHGEKPTVIDDDLLGANFFKVEMVPKWLEPIIFLLTIGTLHNQSSRVAKQSRLYALLARQLFQAQRNRILSLCIEPEEQQVYL